jgi:glycosyltransferase involved in cell wall biosynthesis
VDKPLKIAVLATVTDFGGAEKVVLSLINNIDNESFELVPIIFTIPSMQDNIFFKHLDKTRKKYHRIFVNGYRIKYLNPLVNIIEAYTLLKKHKFDLIHSHGYRADVIGVLLSKAMGLPLISTCHGFISNDHHLTIYNRLDRFMLRFARKIIAVSNGIRNQLIRSGIEGTRVLTIQNAVNVSFSSETITINRQARRQACNLAEKDFVVGYVGRLSEEKGVGYLLEAISMLKESEVPVKLLVIGDGPQKKTLEDFVKGKSIEHVVFFAGFQNEIETWLPAMDVFVLPSLTEGTPMSLLEAMALGIPVVASSVGGVPQVVDSEENGILVSPGKPQDIEQAIQRLFKNEDLRKRFSEEAQKKIKEKYNVEGWIYKIENEYRESIIRNDAGQIDTGRNEKKISENI